MPPIRIRRCGLRAARVFAVICVCLLVYYGYTHVGVLDITPQTYVDVYEEPEVPANISKAGAPRSIRVPNGGLAENPQTLYDSEEYDDYDEAAVSAVEVGLYVARSVRNSSTNIASLQTIGRETDLQKQAYLPTYLNWKDINPYILDLFRLKGNEPAGRFVNQHQFQFSLDSQACKHGKTFIVFVIHSEPNNHAKRNYIRRTFGSPGSYRGKKVSLVFLFGKVWHVFLQDALNEEAMTHDDIVQGNFYDHYKNLTMKHVMAMYWLKNHCRAAEYVMKLDDDTFVNPYRVIDYVLKVQPRGRTLLCKTLRGEKPHREAKSKWFTPEGKYPFPVLPEFCLGFAYITTPETWDAMYRASSGYRALGLDDVYVTAILAMAVNARKVDFGDVILLCSSDKRKYVPKLNTKAIFMDRLNQCGQIPLRYWNYIWKQNSGL